MLFRIKELHESSAASSSSSSSTGPSKRLYVMFTTSYPIRLYYIYTPSFTSFPSLFPPQPSAPSSSSLLGTKSLSPSARSVTGVAALSYLDLHGKDLDGATLQLYTSANDDNSKSDEVAESTLLGVSFALMTEAGVYRGRLTLPSPQ